MKRIEPIFGTFRFVCGRNVGKVHSYYCNTKWFALQYKICFMHCGHDTLEWKCWLGHFLTIFVRYHTFLSLNEQSNFYFTAVQRQTKESWSLNWALCEHLCSLKLYFILTLRTLCASVKKHSKHEQDLLISVYILKLLDEDVWRVRTLLQMWVCDGNLFRKKYSYLKSTKMTLFSNQWLMQWYLLWNSKDVADLGYRFAIWSEEPDLMSLYVHITQTSEYFICSWFDVNLGTYAAVIYKKKTNTQTPQATVLLTFLSEFTWTTFSLSKHRLMTLAVSSLWHDVRNPLGSGLNACT